jgi:hypothetical protein
MNKTQKIAGGIILGTAVLVGGAVGGVVATSSKSTPTAIVQKTDDSTPTTTVPLPAPTTTTAPVAAPVTTLPAGTDPVAAANSAAQSANSAAQSATSAASSAQAAATPPTTAQSYCTGSLAADEAAPQYPAGYPVGNGNPCTDSVGSFIDVYQSPTIPATGVPAVLQPGGWFRVS